MTARDQWVCGFVTLDYCALYKYSYLLTYLLNALDALVSCNKYVSSRRLKQSVLLVGSKKKIREFHRASNCMRKPDGRKTRHIVTIVAWSVCLSVHWSWAWSLQKRLHRSRILFGMWTHGAQGTRGVGTAGATGALAPAMLKPRGRECPFAPAIFSHIFARCSLNFHSLSLCCLHTIKRHTQLVLQVEYYKTN